MAGGAEFFVGRADELQQVAAVLEASRLLTIVGGPGLGKSALAAEVARAAPLVRTVRLSDASAATPVAALIAAACGVREQPGRPIVDSLAVTLAGPDLLLVLDDAERERDQLAPVIERLRLECPRLRILATSRVSLRCRHEVVVPLSPLDDPAAIAVIRHHAGPGVDENEIAGAAARLGGIPLALVVAGRALAGGVAMDLGATPEGEEVARTLGAAIGSVSTDSRALLAFLAALPAGAPGGAVTDRSALDEILDLGLVISEATPPVTRYRLPEPVRELAAGVLTEGEIQKAAEARSAWLQELIDSVGESKGPGDERERLDAAERELPNLAAALAWACEEGHDPAGGARLAAGAVRVWFARSRFAEGARAVDAARRWDTPHRGRLTYYAGSFAQLVGRLADARAAFEEAESIGRAGDEPAVVSLAMAGRATVAFFLGDRAAAASFLAEATILAQQSGDPLARLNTASVRGMVGRVSGDLYAARGAYEEAVSVARTTGDHRSLATALLGVGSVAQLRGDLDEAQARYVEARNVADGGGYPAQLATALGSLGALAEARGDLAESRRLLEESLAAAAAGGEHRTQLETLVNLGVCEIDLSDYDAARGHLGDALGLARRLADRRLAAFALAGLAECSLAEDDVAGAARLEREALLARRDLGDRRTLAIALEESADILMRRDRHDDVGLLLAAADAVRAESSLARAAPEAARADRLRASLSMSVPDPAAADVPGAVDRALELLEELAGPEMSAPVPPPAPPDPAAASGAAVAIRTMGGFSVVVDGQAVPAEAWGSRRARQLVKILVSARGRPVPREQLTLALWPDASPEEEARLGARLSVLLSTARKILGGGITADRAAVALDLDAVEVDLERVLTAVGEDRLDDVVSGYAGDFLPEDVYEEWSTGPREQARLGFLTAARRLARASAAAGAHERAADLCLRTLQADPYDDGAHRLLVTSLVGAGRHGEAARAYEHFAARMSELGIEPPPFDRLAGRTAEPALAIQR